MCLKGGGGWEMGELIKFLLFKKSRPDHFGGYLKEKLLERSVEFIVFLFDYAMILGLGGYEFNNR